MGNTDSKIGPKVSSHIIPQHTDLDDLIFIAVSDNLPHRWYRPKLKCFGLSERLKLMATFVYSTDLSSRIQCQYVSLSSLLLKRRVAYRPVPLTRCLLAHLDVLFAWNARTHDRQPISVRLRIPFLEVLNKFYFSFVLFWSVLEIIRISLWLLSFIYKSFLMWRLIQRLLIIN